MIKVLVVEDSPVVREFLVHVLGADPDIVVVGTASDGEQAVAAVGRCQPDVITMDIHMPRLDGIEATRRIMQARPTPIVIVSGSTDPHEVAVTFHATDAGAVAVLRRPAGIGHPDHEASVRELVQTVKAMSEVKVVRRWPRAARMAAPLRPPAFEQGRVPRRIQAVAVGASTGGPPVLQKILAALPRDFPAPILVVQHMSAGFIDGFVEWLRQSAGPSVRVAVHGERPLPGHVYVAPDDFQMMLGRDGKIVLVRERQENGLQPSVSALFRSLADVHGAQAAAVLLSGMGKDGAAELKRIKDLGAVTIAQDAETSVVHGMPGEAIALDGATQVLPDGKIAAALLDLVGYTGRPGEEGRT